MITYEVVPATHDHAVALAANMRQADVEEVRIMGYEPLPALEWSLAGSGQAYTGLADGEVVCMFGHCPRSLLSDEAMPWLLSSENMPKHARQFLRLNRFYITELRKRYRLLAGWVYDRNVLSIRWLKWLGFTITDTKLEMGSATLYLFSMER